MPVELGYVTFLVPDVSKALAFFGPLFGWEFDQSFGANSAHVANTRRPLGISKGPAGNYSSHYFEVDDLEAMIARVTALGGSVESRSNSPSGANAACTDNQGVRFALWQPAPGFETAS